MTKLQIKKLIYHYFTDYHIIELIMVDTITGEIYHTSKKIFNK